MNDALPIGYRTRALTLADAEAVHAVLAAEERHDLGRVDSDLEDILGEWQKPEHRPEHHHRRYRARTGVLVGYAELADDHGFANVHPDHHGRGLGRWLADWLERRAAAEGETSIGGQVFEGGPADRLLWPVATSFAGPPGTSSCRTASRSRAPTCRTATRPRLATADDHEACWTRVRGRLPRVVGA